MAFLNLILLPFLAALGLFETTPPSGSGGSGSGTSTAAPPAPPTNPPATGTSTPPAEPPKDDKKDDASSDEPLGAPGLSALRAEREARSNEKRRADAAEAELNRIKEANQTEQEKAITAARKEGETTTASKYESGARRMAWRSALQTLGCVDPEAVAMPSEIADLKVDAETFHVEGIDDAAKKYKAAHPNLFVATTPGGSADQGPRGSAPAKPASFADAVTQRLASGSGSR